MDEKSQDVLIQVGVALLQMAFQALKQSGKTETQIDQMFWEEKAKFESRSAGDLPDV